MCQFQSPYSPPQANRLRLRVVSKQPELTHLHNLWHGGLESRQVGQQVQPAPVGDHTNWDDTTKCSNQQTRARAVPITSNQQPEAQRTHKWVAGTEDTENTKSDGTGAGLQALSYHDGTCSLASGTPRRPNKTERKESRKAGKVIHKQKRSRGGWIRLQVTTTPAAHL